MRHTYPRLIFAAFFLAALAACGKTMPTPSFVNQEQGLLRVNNELDARLILFAGTPARENYLGGVPGKVSDFGLALTNGSWLITAVKVEDYMFFRTNAAVMPVSWSRAAIIESAPYTLTVEPGALLSGPSAALFHNKTDSFVEIRNRSWQGTNIATLAPQSSRVQALPNWDFVLYPVRLDWVTNAFRETYLTNSANLMAVYPDKVEEMTITE
ncbi:MAG: hypothetical protein LBC99_02510 [Spirochaetota bacterium]|jgi:hypothetical protein|nr:hypothetical protein [Spirochaetota bacterium]